MCFRENVKSLAHDSHSRVESTILARIISCGRKVLKGHIVVGRTNQWDQAYIDEYLGTEDSR